MSFHFRKPVLALCALSAFAAGAAHAADDVIRHRIPNSTFPIAAAVEIPTTVSTVYLSGQVPPVQDATQPRDNPLAYGGDTRAQTVGVLKAIEKSLAGLGLGLGDVVKMQVFLVGDPAKDNKMDFAGFMEGYTQFFGTREQPNLPTRSVFQVMGLANAAWRVEIEVVAARRK
ncbi:RidA family protein [Cupriavidus basilensis]|uniref:RidA family protein n=1 Tax=Cupriavidus basilensis TaxID=68895 RepID=A0ABT6AM67_9BURK|nr:RidA family protein [Cupriavidus basilensis]MDF3833688.1 RidA family protein [Cupriavidus basilensis]